MDRTWENWKVLCLKADAKAFLKHKSKGSVEKFGGAAMSQGREGPLGRPPSITMDDLEGCFDSRATAAVTGKDALRDLVEANLALIKTVADLTGTNAHLVKKVEGWTNSSGGGGGGGGGGGNCPERKWCKNCKHKI